jgi:Lrp/AsnC family leucine-responsive transcriptional regulator
VDEISIEILKTLRADGRLSQEQIAQKVHLSRPAVHERLKRLEEEGIIRGYKALIDWNALNLPITAFIWVSAEGTAYPQMVRSFMELTTDTAMIDECHRVTGEWCLLLKVRTASPLALQNLLDQIRNTADVRETMTTVGLSTLCEDGLLSS